MPQIRVDIQSIVVGGGPVSSLVVLKPREGYSSSVKLPIRIGTVEAAAISMGMQPHLHKRPMTHDLLVNTIASFGGHVDQVVIQNVEDTIFYARIHITTRDGETFTLDARPSDALALAVRLHAPIYVSESVLDTAALPDFDAVERDEREREAEAFHEFVEGLSPEDFAR